MKTIYGNGPLSEYGINPLTGEACGYSMRVLCDLSAKGEDLIAGFLGLSTVTGSPFPKNWNSRVGAELATASVMLPRGLLDDLKTYILFHVEKCDAIIVAANGAMNGLYKNDENWERWLELANAPASGYRTLYNPLNPSVSSGGRNIHSFTGRVA